MYGSAHANRTATRRNELQTFSVDTTHVQGHFDLYPASYANTLGASELLQLQRRGGAGAGGNLADLASQRKV